MEGKAENKQPNKYIICQMMVSVTNRTKIVNKSRKSAGNLIFKRVFRKNLPDKGIFEQRLGRKEDLRGDI